MSEAGSRITVVDVLRAVALFGIVIAHSEFEFLAGPPPTPAFGQVHEFDPLVAKLVDVFTNGKFFAIFSFLFGLSFSIQLENAARKGAAFAGRFAWRLAVLLLIGAVHQAFFTGDILMIYALLGFLLIPLRNLGNRALLWLAALLALNIPGVLLGLASLMAPPPTAEAQQAAAAAGQQFAEMAHRQWLIKRDGSLLELVTLNYTETPGLKLMFQVFTCRLWMTFGCFLLGMYAGRIGLFRDSPENRALMRRMLIVGGVVAAATTIVMLYHPAPLAARTLLDVLSGFATSVQWCALAAFYTAAVALLYWRQPARGLLPALAPLGRMGLTAYLMQTVFGLVLFYGIGFGLMGSLGSGVATAVGIAFFAAQILMARAWMNRFSMGPVEWLWRSITDLRVRPLAHQATG
jgi:uncharacterized protein